MNLDQLHEQLGAVTGHDDLLIACIAVALKRAIELETYRRCDLGAAEASRHSIDTSLRLALKTLRERKD